MLKKLIFLCLAFIAFFHTQSIAKAVKTKKVLVTNFYFGYHHNVGRALNVALVQQIGKEEGFEVEVVGKNADFTPDKLDGVQVIVMQNLTAPDKLNKEIKEAIIDWNKKGGGIFTTHATLDGARGEWNWLIDNCIYGHYVPHSKIVPAEMRIDKEAYDKDKKLHPMLSGLSEFKGVDMQKGTINGYREEWFNWNNYFRGSKNLKILMNMNTDSYKCNCKITDDHPAIWITEPPEPQGSLSYNLLGHGGEIHDCKVDEYKNNEGKGCNPLLKQFYKNAILYHGGDLQPAVDVKDRTSDNSIISISAKEVEFNVDGGHRFELVNVKGETVYSKSGSNAQKYSLTGLNTGIYFVKTVAGKHIKTKRIFIY